MRCAPTGDEHWESRSVARVAFCMILLVCGGLGRTLLKAYSTDLGFLPANLLVMSFDLLNEHYSGEGGHRFTETLLQRVGMFVRLGGLLDRGWGSFPARLSPLPDPMPVNSGRQ